jgi:hypothetical protein
MTETDLKRIIAIWKEQEDLPYPRGIIKVVADRLYYIHIARRQRPQQTKAIVGLAAFSPFSKYSLQVNEILANEVYERFAEEIQRLGGTVRPLWGKRLHQKFAWRTLQAEVDLREIDYKKVDHRHRVLTNQAFRAREKKVPRVPEPPALTTIAAPRLIKVPQAS